MLDSLQLVGHFKQNLVVVLPVKRPLSDALQRARVVKAVGHEDLALAPHHRFGLRALERCLAVCPAVIDQREADRLLRIDCRQKPVARPVAPLKNRVRDRCAADLVVAQHVDAALREIDAVYGDADKSVHYRSSQLSCSPMYHAVARAISRLSKNSGTTIVVLPVRFPLTDAARSRPTSPKPGAL